MPSWRTWLGRRKRNFFLITSISLVLVGGFVAWKVVSKEGVSEIHPAPVVSLKDREGKAVRLQSIEARAILVHFWASWCAPCIDEIPELLKFAKKYEGKSFRIVLISLDETWADAEKIIGKEALSSNIVNLIDPEIRSGEMFGSYQYPETYLLNGSHEVVTKWIGPQKWGHEFFDQVLDRFL